MYALWLVSYPAMNPPTVAKTALPPTYIVYSTATGFPASTAPAAPPPPKKFWKFANERTHITTIKTQKAMTPICIQLIFFSSGLSPAFDFFCTAMCVYNLFFLS